MKYIAISILMLIACNFFCLNQIISQKIPLKWGKLSQQEIDLKSTSIDTSANAIVLCDYGEISFSPVNPIEVKRHKRIKVLKKQGIDEQANIIIPYYSADGIESVSNVEAQTMNIGSDRKIKLISVEKSKIFDVDESNNWKEIRFSFPAVDVGSILEYSYVLHSEYYLSPKEWFFQSDIPTIHSEYRANIVEGLDVNYFTVGTMLRQTYGNRTARIFVLEYLDAIKEEPYCPNPQDYVEKILFQLASYYKSKSSIYGGGIERVEIMTTWANLAKELLDNQNFNSYIKKRILAKEYLEENIVDLANLNKREKVIAIYNLVNRNFQWNGKYSLNIEKSMKELTESKIGSGIEINMFLTSLLQAADIESSPAILSTKSHGIPTKEYPIINQFNHLVCYLKLNEEDLLLDATDPFRPYELLGTENLNQNIFIVNINTPRLIEPKQTAISKNQITIFVDSITDNHLICKSKLSFSNYSAIQIRKEIQKSNNPSKVINEFLLPDNVAIITDSCIVENPNELAKPLNVRYYFQLEKDDGGTEGYLYIKPFAGIQFPRFISEKRTLPVDFVYKREINQSFVLKIPTNYELIGAPEQQNYTLSDDRANFRIFVKNENNNLTVRIVYKLNTTFFNPSDYDVVKEFYQKIEKAIAATIVLKEKQE